MPTILAVDDNSDNLHALSAVIKNLLPDCVVITALSGMKAIEKAIVESPDVILLDVKMPKMDGFETCLCLKKDKGTRNIPVIMITALKADARTRIKGLEAGADASLAKPIDDVELVSQVKVALRIKKAEDDLLEEKAALENTVNEQTAALSQEIDERKRLMLAGEPKEFAARNRRRYEKISASPSMLRKIPGAFLRQP